jgi:cell division protein FtsB
MFDKDVGENWHLRFRLKLEELQKENEYLKMKNRLLTRKIKKYENNNIRTSWNRQDNNTAESSGRVHTTGNKT